MKTNLILALAMTSSMAAAADQLAGTYVLQMREAASALLLKSDGTFQYAFTYGAADYTAKGTWRHDGNSVILNSTPPAAPPFRIISSRVLASPGFRVWVKAPNGAGVPNIDAVLRSASGELQARTDQDGAAVFPPSKSPSAVVFRIRVYNFESEPLKLEAGKTDVQFEINGEAITQVQFKNEVLRIDGSTLELRHWDPDKPMLYHREKR